jgi:phosphatidylinositol alpha-1,6-mannosyltransferase
MKPDRALLIISSEFPPGPGGLGTHAYQMAVQLQTLGWKVGVITAQDCAQDSEIVRFCQQQPFPVWRVVSLRGPVRGFLSRWSILRRQIKQFRPSLLVATGRLSVWVAALTARLSRLPLVAIGHGSEFGVQNWAGTTVTRWAYEQCQAVICVSEFTRNFMRKMGIRAQREHVILNGADENRFVCLSPDQVSVIRRRLNINAEHILLTVGAVTERKGQEVMIRALPHVLRSHPRTHYLLAGWPHMKPQLEQLAGELEVSRYVHFLGCVPSEQIPGLMNAADIFVMTSKTTASGDCEGFGIAIVEAALCGKPSVVSADSGPAEAIIHGVTGFAVPENDPRATADAVCQLLGNPFAREQMGKAAYERAIQQQTWRKCLLEYHAVFDSMLHQ